MHCVGVFGYETGFFFYRQLCREAYVLIKRQDKMISGYNICMKLYLIIITRLGFA